MPQSMAGHAKRNINGRVIQKIFEVIFHRADRQPVSLFGNKQRRREPTV